MLHFIDCNSWLGTLCGLSRDARELGPFSSSFLSKRIGTDNFMKGCHLPRARHQPGTTPDASLAVAMNDVGKRTALPTSQMGKRRCRGDRITRPKASGRKSCLQASVSGPTSPLSLATRCFRLKSAEAPWWQNFSSLESGSRRSRQG